MHIDINETDHALRMTKEAALEVMMYEYGDRIIQLVYLIVKDRGIAEDITQEVFLKAYRGFDTFRQDSSLKTWLYRIAINESKKYLRSWSFRHIFSGFGKEEDTVARDGGDVEGTVIGKMTKVELAEKVMDISPAYRQVIVLHYYEELSIREVAHVLCTSEENVRTKLSRARKQFKKLLEQEGYSWM